MRHSDRQAANQPRPRFGIYRRYVLDDVCAVVTPSGSPLSAVWLPACIDPALPRTEMTASTGQVGGQSSDQYPGLSNFACHPSRVVPGPLRELGGLVVVGGFPDWSDLMGSAFRQIENSTGKGLQVAGCRDRVGGHRFERLLHTYRSTTLAVCC